MHLDIVSKLGVITPIRSCKMFLKLYNRLLIMGLSFENRVRVRTSVKSFDAKFRKISYSGRCFLSYGPKYSGEAMETYLFLLAWTQGVTKKQKGFFRKSLEEGAGN